MAILQQHQQDQGPIFYKHHHKDERLVSQGETATQPSGESFGQVGRKSGH
jgi:hypothetical protein